MDKKKLDEAMVLAKFVSGLSLEMDAKLRKRFKKEKGEVAEKDFSKEFTKWLDSRTIGELETILE